MKVTTWFMGILIFILTMFTLVAPQCIAAPAPIVIVLGEDSYPFQFLNEQGEPSGLLVDLWKEWSRQVHKPVVFVARHWQDSLNQLEQGNASIHMGMAKTQPRQRIFDFAKPISGVSTNLYIHKELANNKSFSELVPYHIGVVTGSSHEVTLNKLEPKLSYKHFSTREALFQAVAAGEIKVFAGMEGYVRDQSWQKLLAKQFPSTNRLLINRTLFYPAVVKGDDATLALIEQGFSQISLEFVEHVERLWLGYRADHSEISISMQLGVDPFIDIGIDGLPHGLFVDMWELWSEKTGIKINFIPSSMDGSLKNVRSGFTDVHIGYPESEQLKSGLERAWQIYSVKSRLFSYQTEITNLSDFAGKRIGVFPTSPYLAKLKQALPESQLRFYDSMGAMVDASKRGDISAFVAAGALTQHYLLAHELWGEFTQYQNLEFETAMYVLTRHENQGLVKRIRSGFNLISYPEFAKIEQKWMLNIADHNFIKDDQQLVLSDEQLEYLESLPGLTMGYLENSAPMEFRDHKGKFVGIDADIVEIIEKSLHIKLKTIAFKHWNELAEALKSGQVDLAGGLAKSPILNEYINYSAAYWSSPWAIASKQGNSSVYYLNQISNKRLAVIEGGQILSELMSQAPGSKIILVPSANAGIEAVSRGNADLFIDNMANLRHALLDHPTEQISLSILNGFSDRQSYIGLSKQHTSLLPLLDLALLHISKVDKQQLATKWLDNKVVDQDSDQYGVLLIIMSCVLTATLVLILLINQRTHPDGNRIKLFTGRNGNVPLGEFTQLPDRMLLEDRLHQAALSALREHKQFGVMFIHLDGMAVLADKKIAKYASKLVDELINIMHQSIRKSDTLARYSRTEFVIILNHIQNNADADQIAEKLVQQIHVPFDIVGQPIVINPCIGIAVYPTDSDNASDLLQQAKELSNQVQKHAGLGYQVT